jgi:hypothetical protein
MPKAPGIDPCPVTGDKQHYLPAAVIGGFGETEPGTPLREAKVLWRRRDWDEARTTVAHRIGCENKMYRLRDPPAGMSADTVDELWDSFEGPLPGAIVHTAERRETFDDHGILKARRRRERPAPRFREGRQPLASRTLNA